MPQVQYVVGYQLDLNVVVTDIVVIIGVIFGILVVREVLCYFLRINQIQEQVKEMNISFDHLRNDLKRMYKIVKLL